jgi:hypothetical protein
VAGLFTAVVHTAPFGGTSMAPTPPVVANCRNTTEGRPR